jgi:hypothetical protein
MPSMGRRAASDEEPDGIVHLDGLEHSWWTEAEVGQPSPLPPPSERDVLAEHFGVDWRHTFGLDGDPASAGALLDDDAATADRDPYAVLGVDPSAPWNEIVRAHRALARTHHPDLARARGGVEMAEVNAAYRELKIRRGR